MSVKLCFDIVQASDQKFADYLRIAFEARWHRGDPLREVLPLCKLVQETNPKVEKIWEYSTLTPTRQAFVRGMQRFERDAQAKILEGTYTLETKSVSSSPIYDGMW